tara:strand:- start:3981 stop:6200 length:2220 start_codon:yes stop_codon:yes gene_type:complete
MEIENISTALFNKLRGQFPSITVGDAEGNVTNDPKQARFFDFDYTKEGKSFGKISISISEDQGLVVLHSTDIISEADPLTKEGWYNFLKELREFAKSRLMSFDTRDITKSNLEKRDYEYLKKEKDMEPVSESNMFGTNKTSFQQIGDAKLILKHSTIVNPEVPGARSQKIESIFIESPAGERFKFPYKHLNGARAMTRHVAEGGNPYDNFGKFIVGLSEELNKLRKFKTYMNRSSVMAEGLKEYMTVIDERIEEIKSTAQKLQKESGYKSVKETHSETVLEEVPEEITKNWIDELTIKQFNEELKDVFPYIYKLVSEKTAIKNLSPEDFELEAQGYQGGTESRTLRFDVAGDYDPERPVSEKDAEEIEQELAKAGIVADVQPDESRYNGIIVHTNTNPDEVQKALGSTVETLDTFKEFENTIESIVAEDENGLFSSDKEESNQALEKLNKLMAKHFPAGPNGVNGIESLQGIIDDEALASQIKMASKEDADACLRPMIMDYIKAKRPEMLSKIDTGDMKQEVEDEAITFEDIKPYVSIYKGNDGKNVFDVLDKDGKSVQKFDNANAAMKYLHANFDDLRKGSDEKEAMVDPEGNPQYGDESKEIALDLWNDMSKEEKEEHGSFGAYLKSDDFQEYLNKLRSKFEKDAEDKIDVKIDPDGGISKVDGDNSLDNKEETVEDFVKSFFDYTTNQFPKGETAVLTSVEKKFGDGSIKTAQETIRKLMNNKDPEIAKIKKLAGI